MSKFEKSDNKKKNNSELSLLPYTFDPNFASFYASFSYPFSPSFGLGLDYYSYFCPYYGSFTSPFLNSFDLYSCGFPNQDESASCVKITEIKEISDEEKEEKKTKDDKVKFSFNTNCAEDITFNKEDFDKQVEEIKKEYEKLFLKLNSHIIV